MEMVDNHEDPPWLRPAPILIVSGDTDEMKNTQISILPAPPSKPASTSLPATARDSDMASLSPPPNIPTPASSPLRVADKEEEYVGWKPQQIIVQQITLSPPLSPLDLAMYPGVRAPSTADPVEARRAVTGLKPLRILSTRRPGGPASAGASRHSSVQDMSPSYAFSGFMGFFSAATKRASAAVASEPPSASSRASIQSVSVAHAPIPVSPLPSPGTPPLVPKPSLAPELLHQMEPELKAHLDALTIQAAAGPSPRPVSASRPPQNVPIEEEEMELEIRDLTTGEIIKIRDLDAIPLSNGTNRESHSTSQRSPSISDFMVIRNLDAQPHTPPLPRSQQRNKTPESGPLTPPRSSSPIESPSLAPPALSDTHQTRQGLPVSPLTEAVHVNRSLELSLSNLEDALSVARKSHHSPLLPSTFQRNEHLRIRAISPQTTRTASSLTSSMFSSRMIGTPLTTPPTSPSLLSQRSKYAPLPCTICSRPMQHMTSTRCGHVFCRSCIEGRSQCPVCRDSMEDSDLRAIYLFV